jgi:NADH-quinone oxidoreductase subunit M
MATFYVITALALIGLPILNGFVGEFLILSGSFAPHRRWAGLATIGVILGAAYMLWMIQRIFYGPQSSLVTNSRAPDLVGREYLALVPMVVLMIAMGVASPYWMHAINDGVSALANSATQTVTNATMAEKR